MKHNIVSPCKECPFKKGCIPGWLGHDSPEEVMRQVHSESGYACHMDMSKKAVDGIAPLDITEQCAGALLHANLTNKLYRNPELSEHQKRVKTKKGQSILGLEFLTYHSSEESQHGPKKKRRC